MSINISLPPVMTELKPKITVVGVGGAGGNAINNMITSHLEGVEFVACNTDAQAITSVLTDRRIQLGSQVTHGLGAGARPEVGKAAAEESLDEILDQLSGSHMVFITAGMGGGTGTGAAPVIARAVREQGILTVGVVTKPFQFEGAHRMRLAEAGLAELQTYVDTLIVIPNQNLFRLANERTTFADAFRMADQVLHMGVRGVTDLMVMPGLINLDFADIRTVMGEMGKAMMGTGEAEGERRAIEAAEAAISNPLLDDVSMKGARGVLINITGGMDMTLFEVDAAATRIREEVDPDANIIFGSTFDTTLDGRMRVSVVSTGIDAPAERPAVAPAEHRHAAELAVSTREQAPVFRFQPQAPRGAGAAAAAVAGQLAAHNPFARAAAARRPEADPALQLRAASGGGATSAAYHSPRVKVAEAAPPAPAPAPVARAAEPSSPSQPAEDDGPGVGTVPVRPFAGVAERGPNLFERVKELAFARGSAERAPAAPNAEPADYGHAHGHRHGAAAPVPRHHEEQRPAMAGAQDELGDIPSFLRRGERVAG